MAVRKDNAPKSFREVPCARCGNNFQSTGPNHKRCDPCKVEHKREYERTNKKRTKTRLSACLRCGEAFSEEVHAHQRYCGPCAPKAHAEANKRRIKRNPAPARKHAIDHYYRNKERILERRKTPEERAKIANRQRMRTLRDNGFRVYKNFSRQVSLSLNGDKGGRRWQDLVGYTLEDLKRHLERQFTKGMTWDNYGEWHIDHILPRASFSITTADDPEFRQCWSLTNLRPLWKTANISKGAKRLHLL